jgi:hypothetical protein
VKVKHGTVYVLAQGPMATLAELAGVPDAARGLGIPPEATITYVSVTQGYTAYAAEDSRRAELTIGWAMP